MQSLLVGARRMFPLPENFYMQIMEPLGVTDGSVEAAWDFARGRWREDFVHAAQRLAPDCIRWGGVFSSYYRWKEGIGSKNRRRPVFNLSWDGMETNQVGTHEFVDLCRCVGAQPLICVNFMSDGKPEFTTDHNGSNRCGTAKEAADWVSYCNDPDNRERRKNGPAQPYHVNLWQVGNETSYHPGGLTKDEAIAAIGRFAREMKRRDPSIKVIGWGDIDNRSGEYWARDLLLRAGEHLDFVAVHMMNQRLDNPSAALKGDAYDEREGLVWQELNGLLKRIDEKLRSTTEIVCSVDPTKKVAITEGHLTLLPYNSSRFLRECQSAVYHGRVLNLYERYADKIEMATISDFCGTRWTVNALMIPVPMQRVIGSKGRPGPSMKSYLLPAGLVAALYKHHRGRYAIPVLKAPSSLDVTGSRVGDTVFLHVVNCSLSESATVRLAVEDHDVVRGTIDEMCWESPHAVVSEDCPDAFGAKGRSLGFPNDNRVTVRAGSVNAITLKVRKSGRGQVRA